MSNRVPDPKRQEHVDAFLGRTDPLVVQAMRKTSGYGQPLTIEEQAALEAWLEPRIAALVDRLADRMRWHQVDVTRDWRRRAG